MLRYPVLVLLLLVTGLTNAQVKYTLRYVDSSRAVVSVRIELAKPMFAPIDLVMPRSIPGAYNMLKYDYFIEQPRATGFAGKTYPLVKNFNDAPRFTCSDSGAMINSINYEVNLYKMEHQLFTPTDASIIRPGFAGILNYSVFGWIDGTELEPVLCSIQTFGNWPIFSTLVPSTKLQWGRLEFATDNYYSLADGQTFLGPAFQVKEYKGLVPLFVASYSQTTPEYLDDYGWQETTSMEILKDYFGDPPFKHYSLMLRSAIPPEPDRSGGFAMEHLQSSTFFNDTTLIRTKAMTSEERLQTRLPYLHHMAHSYLPLRCYGDTYRPHVLEIPPVINNIWFNEGFIWYLAYDTTKAERLLRGFKLNVYDASPLIKKLSLQQLSQTASLQYGDDFRLGRAVFSRGALMAKEMNEHIQQQTGGKKSIKDVYKYLYQWSQKNKRPFIVEEFPGLLKAATGVDLLAIYTKWQAPIK
jgi:predicted metalloprotease with PDZ domain